MTVHTRTHLLSTEASGEPAPSNIAYLRDALTDAPPAGMTIEASVVLLKQFRDAADPTVACHQSPVLAQLALTALP